MSSWFTKKIFYKIRHTLMVYRQPITELIVGSASIIPKVFLDIHNEFYKPYKPWFQVTSYKRNCQKAEQACLNASLGQCFQVTIFLSSKFMQLYRTLILGLHKKIVFPVVLSINQHKCYVIIQLFQKMKEKQLSSH